MNSRSYDLSQNASEPTKSSKPIPLGDQRKAVLRQELMVLLMNLGMLINGTTLALPAVTLDQLTNPVEPVHLNKSQASWYASASVIACPIGCFSGVFLVDKFGRKVSVCLVNIFGVLAWILMSTATYDDPSYVFLQLMASRLLSGVAAGSGSSPAAVYGAEVCLPKLRARLTNATSMAIAAGVLLVYIVGYFVREDWRMVGIVMLIYQFICLVILIPVKETPSWLLSKGRVDEAKASLSYFRGLDEGETHQEVEDEFTLLRVEVPLKAKKEKSLFFKSFCLPEVYKPLLIAIFFFVCQQFSGTFVVVVYAVQIITKAGVLIDPFLCAIYVGIARFIVTSVVITWQLENWGRRQVSMFSAATTSLCLFVLAGSSWFTWLQIPTLSAVVIVTFVVASAGLWTIPFLIMPEIFPQKVRGAFCGFTVGVADLIAFSSIKIFPSMIDWIGTGNVFAFYGGIAVLTIFFVYWFIPETKVSTANRFLNTYYLTNKIII
ncbi:facilitated trehalose transporter Tret1-like [Episyrphus balteatus]|uniref:facilitated trehalose transporter Tret1-like n=1 Tax=Episyrphus balteatus TaxID=286459 RepID=UPI0024868BA2|nr:facilitated trehalose transporter Tret1-like [Episyrphus balteatus]